MTSLAQPRQDHEPRWLRAPAAQSGAVTAWPVRVMGKVRAAGVEQIGYIARPPGTVFVVTMLSRPSGPGG